ncbi:MAG: amidohydrolase family protein [Ruminococcus sp.]|nr:amidohydrolase family protein [Ruminococcus sp.]
MIIDFHTHAFNPKIADKAIAQLEKNAGFPPLTRGRTEQLKDRMDEWGVDKSVLLSIATKPTQQTVVNNWAAKINKEEERFFAFGSVHPDAEDCCEEAERIKELGLHGIKLHPDYQRFLADDPRVDEMYECISELGLPVIFHAGLDVVSPDLIHCPPERSIKLIRRHPKLKVVLAHLGGNEQWQQVYDILSGIDGEVYFDTAFTTACPDELMLAIIRKHGVERILFGSDCPWDSAARIAEKLLRIDLTDDERDRIFSGNALRLLGMNN